MRLLIVPLIIRISSAADYCHVTKFCHNSFITLLKRNGLPSLLLLPPSHELKCGDGIGAPALIM